MKFIPQLIVFLLLTYNSRASTFIVTDTTASSPFSLSQAIVSANALAGRDTIDFNIPNVASYIVTDSLPDITDTLFINGSSQPGIKLTGDKCLVIRSPGCTITGLIFYRTSGGFTIVADSLKSIDNTTISHCVINELQDSLIGINIYSLPGSLNSSGILLDSVMVYVDDGKTGLNIQCISSGDITTVTLSHSHFQSYDCPLACYTGNAVHINRQINFGTNPQYVISDCNMLGKVGLEGFLDSIYIGHNLFHGGCDYLAFENASMSNSLIEYNTFENGAASCGATIPRMLNYNNFISDTIRNIHISKNSFLGGGVFFDFTGNDQVFDSIFFENDTIRGELHFIKQTGNADTVYISNIFIRNNQPDNNWILSPFFFLDFSGVTSVTNVYVQNNLLTKPNTSITLNGDSSTNLRDVFISNNVLNLEYGTGIPVHIKGRMENLQIASNSMSAASGYNPTGIAINCEGEMIDLKIFDNNLDSLANGIVFHNQFRFNAKVYQNNFNSCGDFLFDSPLRVTALYVDTGYSLEIESNIFSNSSGPAINIIPPYLPPLQNLNPIVFRANSIFNSTNSPGINRQSQHDTASCLTCIPAPQLLLADYSLGSTTVSGSLQGDTTAQYVIEFFRNSIADTSGFGEGEYYIGRDTIFADSSGHCAFSTVLNIYLLGQFITATATSLNRMQTSEFSNNIPVISILGIQNATTFDLEISPNPFTSQLLLTFGNKRENLNMRISELTGRLVFAKEIISETQQLDLSFLNSGLYIISLQTSNDIYNKMIVKD